MNLIDHNKLSLTGEVISDPVFYRDIHDERFFIFDLKVSRLSNNYDIIPTLISEKILDGIKIGICVTIEGQLRTHNRYQDHKRKLLILAFAREVEFITRVEMDSCKNPNNLIIIGTLCKPPKYRITPLKREITDMCIAVNRDYNKSDYLPAIAWGRNAKFCEKFQIGTHVKVTARVQSREYLKKTNGDELGEKRTAHEISISKINLHDFTAASEA